LAAAVVVGCIMLVEEVVVELDLEQDFLFQEH
jgi:hypothetical protein